MNIPLIGKHKSMNKIRELVGMVSDMDLNVLIVGETGTGKDVVARYLHSLSSRRKKSFIKVNCAALPLMLLESELFGYEKGAFTGATELKPGKFEIASGGVIFLDEIGDMPMVIQAKLLNVLQNNEFCRLGGTMNIRPDVRVITATNHDLNKDIKSGNFREDLFYRLNVIKIEMPPLRERKEDIPLLSKHFINKNIIDLNLDTHLSISQEIKSLFQVYHWPGNVRELSSIILRLMLDDEGENVKDLLLKNIEMAGIDPSYEEANIDSKETIGYDTKKSIKVLRNEAINYIERKAITHVLKMTDGNKSKASRKLNISYKTLYTKIHDLGIK